MNIGPVNDFVPAYEIWRKPTLFLLKAVSQHPRFPSENNDWGAIELAQSESPCDENWRAQEGEKRDRPRPFLWIKAVDGFWRRSTTWNFRSKCPKDQSRRRLSSLLPPESRFGNPISGSTFEWEWSHTRAIPPGLLRDNETTFPWPFFFSNKRTNYSLTVGVLSAPPFSSRICELRTNSNTTLMPVQRSAIIVDLYSMVFCTKVSNVTVNQVFPQFSNFHMCCLVPNVRAIRSKRLCFLHVCIPLYLT